MRTSGDVCGADAASSRSDEERGFKQELNDSNSRPGSRRSVRSSRKEEETDSDSSSKKNTTTRNNPIHYTDQQQAELLRKLDSIKDHLLRGGGNANVAAQPPMGFHGHGPSYYNPYPYGMYPSTSNPVHVPPYGDPYGLPMHRKPPNWYPAPVHYPNQMLPRPPFTQGQYVDIGPDILDPQLQDPRFFPVTPSRYGDVPYSPVKQHGEKTEPFSPHGSVQSHHARWPSEVDSEMGGAFARGYVQKSVSDTDSRRCHPLAGGAPFIACHNCFELLYLPKKKLLAQEREQKLQCGACSEVVSFAIVDKKLVFSSSALVETTNQVSVKVEDRSATTAVVDDCPLKDEEPRERRETKAVLAVSPSEHSDDDERSSISSEPQKQVVKSVRRRTKGAKVPPPPPPENSNLLELFEYSNVNRAALTYGMAQSGYIKQESYMKQDSLKPESEATETDVSYNGYYDNTDVSEDSRIPKTSKEERRPRNRKESSEYSFSEVTDKIISNDYNNDQLEVWVNGHLIPEDRVINAEKQAGPVQAGKYWYDYRAGFWGVMGNPCLGIIPPFIEEFSRPMPDNCGAGNTSVFVNGRELHERDLELLSSRGLPRGKNRSYIVDISGRVLDGDSGEELKSLGKLAPTVDKVKHGFGMRVPRSLVS
ncbi:Protein ENHANCED DISEASE RESISTANCE 4 [Cardamine amara subsp. amara]|uniref:Protein ENHANCED DISEASE RESISTANCE 4 n=1 Tax=Cardamine amara subsp. amara TaxID=228776 RepID=A0ABD1BU54_CARAN